MNIDDLRSSPFQLDDGGIQWVTDTLGSLSLDAKVAQLFVLVSESCTDAHLDEMVAFQPGGIGRFFGTSREELDWIAKLQGRMNVPLLVGSDLEGSIANLLPFSTPVPTPLGVAASGDLGLARDVFSVLADDARRLGVNCSFTPCVDINAAWRSAIVATHSYGSDPSHIEALALAQLDTFKARGIATTAKHWPGEGYDDRDQHLVTTANPLSKSDWNDTFGRLYGSLISAGVPVVMAGHIAFPAYMREQGETDLNKIYLPASINSALIRNLLRTELGFNGLVITDSTEMGGLLSVMRPQEARLAAINAGCDMLVFTRSPADDLKYLIAAAKDGRLGPERLDDAVMRILGFKAMLRQASAENAPAMAADNDAIAQRAFRAAPTLVKDRDGLLPLNPEKYRRVLVISSGVVSTLSDEIEPLKVEGMLAAFGFSVTHLKRTDTYNPEDFDLVLWLLAEESLFIRNRIFLDWLKFGDFRFAMNRNWYDIPYVMVSFGHPYYLYDVPRISTYINAYSAHEEQQKAVVELLLGHQDWNSFSPVDATCGLEDALL